MLNVKQQRQLDLQRVNVPEERYVADFELLNRYQGFGTEVVRLSLLGISVFGFFFANFPGARALLTEPWVLTSTGLSASLFLAAMACAVAHRS